LNLPPELCVEKAVSVVGAFHILVDEGDRKDEVYIKSVYYVGDHAHCNGQGYVLEVSHLNVHRPELNTPANIRILSWRVLKPKRVPVSGLEVLEMRISIHGRAFKEPSRADTC